MDELTLRQYPPSDLKFIYVGSTDTERKKGLDLSEIRAHTARASRARDADTRKRRGFRFVACNLNDTGRRDGNEDETVYETVLEDDELGQWKISSELFNDVSNRLPSMDISSRKGFGYCASFCGGRTLMANWAIQLHIFWSPDLIECMRWHQHLFHVVIAFMTLTHGRVIYPDEEQKRRAILFHRYRAIQSLRQLLSEPDAVASDVVIATMVLLTVCPPLFVTYTY
jgi:hypothetical protein